MIDFNYAEMAKVGRIADRFEELAVYANDRRAFLMDVAAADGCNGNIALDLNKLLTFPVVDFLHDCYGIQNHLDRTTGQLTDCFLPRCAITETEGFLPDSEPEQFNTELTEIGEQYVIPGTEHKPKTGEQGRLF